LLGLPADVAACVFNVDGVLVGSAAIHAEAWRETFDEFISRRVERTGGSFAPFSLHVDYPTHIHGRSRVEAVREFLASRGISLPDGSPDDLPGAETVHGLANRKKRALLRLLGRSQRERVRRGPPVPGARTRRQRALRGRLGQHQHAGNARPRTPHGIHRRVRGREHDARRGAAAKAGTGHAHCRVPSSRRRAPSTQWSSRRRRTESPRAVPAASSSSSRSTRAAKLTRYALRAQTSWWPSSAISSSASWRHERAARTAPSSVPSELGRIITHMRETLWSRVVRPRPPLCSDMSGPELIPFLSPSLHGERKAAG
jgi:hypothetical protein